MPKIKKVKKFLKKCLHKYLNRRILVIFQTGNRLDEILSNDNYLISQIWISQPTH